MRTRRLNFAFWQCLKSLFVQFSSALFSLNIFGCIYCSINDIAIEVFRNNRWIEMTAPPADAASKIAVDDMNFEWPYERQSIKEKYPDFPVYATKNSKPDSWWK